MASLYAQYIHEKTRDKISEWRNGFLVYQILNDGKTLYIKDIYVVPDERRSGIAAGMADSVVDHAKAMGAVELLGTVVPSSKNSTDSLRVLLAYGMSLQSSSQDLVVLRKDI